MRVGTLLVASASIENGIFARSVVLIYEVTDRHIRGLIVNQPIEEPAIDAIYRDSFREASATLTQVQTNKNGMRLEMRRLHLTQVQQKEDKKEGVEIRLETRRLH